MNEQDFARRVVMRSLYGDFAERLATYLQTADKSSARYKQICELLDTAQTRQAIHLKGQTVNVCR
jgi:hypothetical protein